MPNFTLNETVDRAEKVTGPFPVVVVTAHGDEWAYRGDYVVHLSDGTRRVVRASEAVDVLHPESARAEADLERDVDSRPHSAKRDEAEVSAPNAQTGKPERIVGFVTETEVYNPAADGSENPSVLESRAFSEATDEAFSLADDRDAEGVKGESPDNQAPQGAEAQRQVEDSEDSPHGDESEVTPQADVPEESDDEQHGASHEAARQVAFVGVETGAVAESRSSSADVDENVYADDQADAVETGEEDPNQNATDDPKEVAAEAERSPDNQDPVRPADDL